MQESAPPPSGRAAAPETVREIVSTLERGEIQTAIALARAALARGEIHSLFLNLRASQSEVQGKDAAALSDLLRAHELDPTDVSVSNALGLMLAKHERHLEAIKSYNAALLVAPQFAPSQFNKAVSCEAIGDLDAARRCYGAAAAIDSRIAEPFARLAGLAIRRGACGEAVRFAHEALARDPRHAAATRALIAAGLEQDGLDKAESRIAELLGREDLSAHDRYLTVGLLGELRERQLRFPEAYAAFVEGNEAYYRANRARFGEHGTARAAIQWLTNYYGAAPRLPALRPEKAQSGAAGHVFLLGFPRSGTTLLEQALASHPNVVTMEEKEAFAASVRAFMGNLQDHKKLFLLDQRSVEEHRSAYWRSVAGHGLAIEGKVFVDKHPFHTVKLPLIAALFPEAKVLFAVRDPRDVVLGCLRARFRVNPYMIELLRPQDAATFYSVYMNLAALYRRALSLPIHEVRHEDLVTQFDSVCRGVCSFIGIDWSATMRDFAARQSIRAVATPSGRQLIGGLRREGIGRWRRYADQLAPILPVLAPWVDRFGYDA